MSGPRLRKLRPGDLVEVPGPERVLHLDQPTFDRHVGLPVVDPGRAVVLHGDFWALVVATDDVLDSALVVAQGCLGWMACLRSWPMTVRFVELDEGACAD